MSVAIRKIPGVESVEVSLNRGVATIKLRPGNSVSPDQVRDVVRDNGFTPKDAELEVAGRIESRGGRWVLASTGSGLEFLLEAHPDAPNALDGVEASAEAAEAAEERIVAGRLGEAKPHDPPILQVRRVGRRAR